jgi:hypothetical protein
MAGSVGGQRLGDEDVETPKWGKSDGNRAEFAVTVEWDLQQQNMRFCHSRERHPIKQCFTHEIGAIDIDGAGAKSDLRIPVSVWDLIYQGIQQFSKRKEEENTSLR